jgi:hypothetical protein
MEWNLTNIAILLGVLLFGYVIGLVEANLKASKKIRALESQLRHLEVPPAAAGSKPAGEKDLLRLWTPETAGDLHLDLDGQRVNPQALGTAERQRLIALLSRMRPWLEARQAAPPASPGPEAPAAAPAAQPTAARPAAAGTVRAEDEPPTANSIVAQVNRILKARIAGTSLAERGITLQESTEGGVFVYVGLTRYNGVDEVPDPQVQAAIRAAIAEWENRATPGG